MASGDLHLTLTIPESALPHAFIEIDTGCGDTAVGRSSMTADTLTARVEPKSTISTEDC